MKKQKNKKKLKGMTLVEVLVALAIFAIISSVLASTIAFVCNVFNRTDRLNKKINNEAPAAELQQVAAPTESISLTLTVEGTTYPINVDVYRTEDSDGNYEEGGDFKYFKTN